MAYKTHIYRDAETEELVLQRVDATTGTPLVFGDTDYVGSITLGLGAAIMGSDGNYHDLKPLEIEVCVSGEIKKTIGIFCDPF